MITPQLSPTEFAGALQKGHGRAWLHVHQFGVRGVEDALLAACLHNQVYDIQCEGPRDAWLAELLVSGGLVERWFEAADQENRDISTRNQLYDASMRCGIARELAARGHAAARAYLYASFAKYPNSLDVLAAEEIIALDGAAGLLHVAAYLGELAGAQPTLCLDDTPRSCYDAKHGDGAAQAVLLAAAEQMPAVAMYLKCIDAKPETDTATALHWASLGSPQPANSPPHADILAEYFARMHAVSAEAVVAKIEADGDLSRLVSPRGWGRHADDQALWTVFAAMLEQHEPKRIIKYLQILAARGLPSFDARLLAYAHHADREVRRVVHQVLAHFAHPMVRELALESLRAGEWSNWQLQMLQRNFAPGDEQLLETVFTTTGDPATLHSLGSDLVDLFEREPRAISLPGLLFVYEQSPCTNCRYRAVKELLAANLAPPWLVAECRHDSSDEVRELVVG